LDTPDTNPNWERRLLEKIAFASIKEQRARRRWGVFFKLAVLVYLIAGLVLLVDWEGGSEKLADGKRFRLFKV
jgi:protease-4